ncbi:Mfa1 family fimbria major subunit [Prevotella sp.]|uniref:Mfa1 family fimbria major subunit n=1 Tax=Prevotella sp. TaxID=59823 RepID=UPI0027E31014|nr:Mfa1 family fimbria major subunit [Prevotella sp.]
MVNVKNLFGMAVMATALVGCASNDDITPNGNDNESNKVGTAYASFKINLPTVSGTRAPSTGNPDDTPDFKPGTADEYEVKNGTILIFDANTKKYVTKADLGNMNPWKDVKTGGVTTEAIATVKLEGEGVSVTDNYLALVLLNNNTGTADEKVTLPTGTITYDEWNKVAKNAKADKYLSTDGIFMANAPMFTSTTTDPTTLVPVANVCASPEEAKAKTATTIYVERGLAKVTMKNFYPSYTIAAGTYKDDEVVINTWQLDVTNKSTFPIHQADLKSGWSDIWNTDRFYDKDKGVFKRVYWGEDPNYDKDVYSKGTTTKSALEYCKDAFNMISNAEVVGLPGDDKPQYCLENTFNLANMMQGQTTRVVFKAVYTPKALKGKTGDDLTFFKIGNNTAIWTKANLEKQIKAVAFTVMGITDPDEQAMYSVDLAKGSNISGVAGQHLIAVENFKFDAGGSTKTSKVSTGVVAKINAKLGLTAAVGISTYLHGEAYYIARIKHFNELTKWTAGTPYNGDNNAFLGRYGVLRNNWYELSVKSISNLGYPEVPEVKPNVPDDENDKYINVEVKILDWAKRTQEIEL